MHLYRQRNKNTKNLPHCYNYSSNNTVFSFKQAKCCNICPLENFKKPNEISQQASLSTGTDLEPIPLCI